MNFLHSISLYQELLIYMPSFLVSSLETLYIYIYRLLLAKLSCYNIKLIQRPPYIFPITICYICSLYFADTVDTFIVSS